MIRIQRSQRRVNSLVSESLCHDELVVDARPDAAAETKLQRIAAIVRFAELFPEQGRAALTTIGQVARGEV